LSDERWQSIKGLVAEALELPTARRAAMLEEACPDADVRAEVESLLAAADTAPEGFLAEPAAQALSRRFAAVIDEMPERIGPCRLIRQLGRGGAATVFLGEMVEPRRFAAPGTQVAIKVLHPHLLAENAQARLEREALLGATVQHPAFVPTHALESAELGGIEIHFLIQEYVSGRSLREIMRAGAPLADPVIRDLGRQMADGLQVLHEHGAVHRDLKPENVLLTAGDRVRILDLGIAHLRDGESTPMTVTGLFLGSTRYAAPEQFDDGPLGQATDLYSLGVLMYEAATGVQPFDGGSAPAIMRLHLHHTPSPPRERNPQLTALLDAVIMHLLHKEPHHRLGPASELARILAEGEESKWWRRRS